MPFFFFNDTATTEIYTLSLHDALPIYVQSVLNGLWAGGAEAVAVQDQRLVTTSAARCIGNTLLLAGRTYSPPYVITAIGDPARLQADRERTRLNSNHAKNSYAVFFF